MTKSRDMYKIRHRDKDGKTFKIFDVEKMYGLGTPEDLNSFLKDYKWM